MTSNAHLVWEFVVRPGCEAAFVDRYGPDGDWARLFGRADGFLGTQLLRDRNDDRRFLTIDRWQSAEAHAAFRRHFEAEYTELDRQLEALTVSERNLGSFAG